MRTVRIALAVLLVVERLWKHWLVVRFFWQPIPSQHSEPSLVSILQPILSGDPTLERCLERNLRARSRYRREFIWLVDTNDAEGQRICQALVVRYSHVSLHLELVPPPAERVNPKMVKLIHGAQIARGDIICVLDDDTQLPDDGLEQCLPYLDQPGVGLAFGLPYYLHFATIWSGLVATFVNSHSLLTYIPYTVVSEPFTINGMFYVLRRSVLDACGGFAGLEHTLADDFAIAQRIRGHGYHLAQTPLRHGISTHVTSPSHYTSLIQRWFIFPRESLLRHLSLHEQGVLYGLGLVPAFFPLLLLLDIVIRPRRSAAVFASLYAGYNIALTAHLNAAYLRHATPRQYMLVVPLIQLIFPIQLLVALLSPQRIIWRGHVMEVQQGGGLEWVRRRGR